MDNKVYLLDTNILIELIHENRNVIQQILKVGLNNCCMSVISLHELYYGAYNIKKQSEKYFQQEMQRINMLRQRFQVLPLPEEADEYGKIKTELIKKGRGVDEFDMIIGGQAISNQMIVVTDNEKHFNRMSGLTVENWTVEN